MRALGLVGQSRETVLELRDRLVTNEADATAAKIGEAMEHGIPVAELLPLTARYFEIKIGQKTP